VIEDLTIVYQGFLDINFGLNFNFFDSIFRSNFWLVLVKRLDFTFRGRGWKNDLTSKVQISGIDKKIVLEKNSVT
jgi:hypothetical protein